MGRKKTFPAPKSYPNLSQVGYMRDHQNRHRVMQPPTSFFLKGNQLTTIGPGSDGFGTSYKRLPKCFRQNGRTPTHTNLAKGFDLQEKNGSQPVPREEAKPHRVVKGLVGNFSRLSFFRSHELFGLRGPENCLPVVAGASQPRLSKPEAQT